MTTEPDEARAREMIEETFIHIQRELDLAWSDVAHALIAYGVDALHVNAGPEGVEGELQTALATVQSAITDLGGSLQ